MSIRRKGRGGSARRAKVAALRAARTGKKSGRKKTRRRRTPEEARTEALGIARTLLLEEGPDSITLQRVAGEIGMTHSNLLHHFGSADELQAALMTMMVADLTASLKATVAHIASEEAAPRALVEQVFEAFEKGGAGKLAAWIALSGNLPQLDAIGSALDGLVKAISEKFAAGREDARLGITSMVLLVALMAFGDAVIGDPLKDMLKRERAAPAKIVSFVLGLMLDPQRAAALP